VRCTTARRSSSPSTPRATETFACASRSAAGIRRTRAVEALPDHRLLGPEARASSRSGVWFDSTKALEPARCTPSRDRRSTPAAADGGVRDRAAADQALRARRDDAQLPIAKGRCRTAGQAASAHRTDAGRGPTARRTPRDPCRDPARRRSISPTPTTRPTRCPSPLRLAALRAPATSRPDTRRRPARGRLRPPKPFVVEKLIMIPTLFAGTPIEVMSETASRVPLAQRAVAEDGALRPRRGGGHVDLTHELRDGRHLLPPAERVAAGRRSSPAESRTGFAPSAAMCCNSDRTFARYCAFVSDHGVTSPGLRAR